MREAGVRLAQLRDVERPVVMAGYAAATLTLALIAFNLPSFVNGEPTRHALPAVPWQAIGSVGALIKYGILLYLLLRLTVQYRLDLWATALIGATAIWWLVFSYLPLFDAKSYFWIRNSFFWLQPVAYFLVSGAVWRVGRQMIENAAARPVETPRH